MQYKNLKIRSSLSGLLSSVTFTFIIIIGCLREHAFIEDPTRVGKYIFQTLGFEQRWGMYGYNYNVMVFTRYLYRFSDGSAEYFYPRYWKQSEYNPFRFVKSEDFQWLYLRYSPAQEEWNKELVTHLMQYFCRHPEINHSSPLVGIEFQTTEHLSFPNLEDQSTIYDRARLQPQYFPRITIRCDQ